MAVQSPSAVVLVRPHHFNVNPVTAADNAFQRVAFAPAEELARSAYREVTGLAEALTEAGVRVHLFEDETEERPDSVFPNRFLTWIAFGSALIDWSNLSTTTRGAVRNRC